MRAAAVVANVAAVIARAPVAATTAPSVTAHVVARAVVVVPVAAVVARVAAVAAVAAAVTAPLQPTEFLAAAQARANPLGHRSPPRPAAAECLRRRDHRRLLLSGVAHPRFAFAAAASARQGRPTSPSARQ